MSPNKTPEELGSVSPTESDARRRVTKACDRCRLKKIKCDGLLPCTRCQADSSICQYGERKKSIDRRIPPGYVEYLEDSQQLLVKALKKSWTQSLPSSSETQPPDDPSVHAILEDLGVLSENATQSSSGEEFRCDEDLENVRQSLEEGPPNSTKSLSSSQAPSRVPSRPTSDAPSPTNVSPTMERRGYNHVYTGQGLGPNPYSGIPHAPMSVQEHSTNWFDATPLSHSATYPTLFPQPSGTEWNYRPDIQFQNIPEQMSQFNEGIDQSGQGFADWARAAESQQPRQFPPQTHRTQQLQQQRQMNPSITSQGSDSTISPAQLSLPMSFQPYDQTDEEAWSRWLNER